MAALIKDYNIHVGKKKLYPVLDNQLNSGSSTLSNYNLRLREAHPMTEETVFV